LESRLTSFNDLDDDELVKQINDSYKRSRESSRGWRKENRDLHNFRSGHQWSEEDKAILEEQGRPPVVFNRAGTIIDAVIGNEISNRQDIRFFPRTTDDSQLTQIATEAVRWVRNECNAEDEESDAFEDTLIGGMGWIETSIDYDENGEPIIVMNRVDPVEMYWDQNARKHNLEDRKYQIREKWMPMDEAKAMWPTIADLKPAEGLAPELDDEIRNADPPFYERESTGFDKREKQVRVLEYQIIEMETVFRVQNPLNDKVESINENQLKKLNKRFPDLKYARIKKPHCYRAYIIGDTLLEKGDGPDKCRFNYQCITGKRDNKDNTFYGLMRGIKDPQEWANKFFSQILHIINSNSKGGFFFEDGALANEQQAREDLSRPDGLVKLKPNGLQKIKERQMFQFPAGIDRMLEFAITSIRDVPGVNLELLGSANREQAGVVESQRSRQALAVLAPMFSNLRRYRKNEGKTLLYFIREYIPEGRLIRVVGEDGMKVIPLMKDPMSAEYDVIVEQSPSSPNMKTEAWVALRDVLPILQAAGMQPPNEIVDVLPLPESITQKWKESIKNGPPPEIKQQMDQMNQEIQKLQQENQQLQSGAQVKMMGMQMDQQMQDKNLQLQAQRLQEETAMRMEQMNQTHQMKMHEMQMDAQLKREQMKMDLEIEQERLMSDMNMKMEISRSEALMKSDSHAKECEMKKEMAMMDMSMRQSEMTDNNQEKESKQEESKEPQSIHINVDAKREPMKVSIVKTSNGYELKEESIQ
jgi:hypothetical protein